MTSKIKVNILADGGDNAIITSDGAGSFTASSGLASSVSSQITFPDNTPSFKAQLSSNQTISHATYTKINFDTEVYDTDGCYDNSTNYRFTPTTAGKYVVYGQMRVQASNSTLDKSMIVVRKNGTSVEQLNYSVYYNNPIQTASPYGSVVMEMNGTTDYLEIFGFIERSDTSSGTIRGDIGTYLPTFFGAYKIIE